MQIADPDPNRVAHSLADSLEPVFAAIEVRFNIVGRHFGISLLTGPLRTVFGCVQAIVCFVIAFFKFLQGFLVAICVGRKEAQPHFEATSLAIRYMVHGAANMVRGALEMLQIAACANANPENHPLKYACEMLQKEGEEEIPLKPFDHRLELLENS